MSSINLSGGIYIIIYLVSIQLASGTQEIPSGSLRLQNGTYNGTGRVEIFHRGKWGTICDTYWDLKDAKVACRQLGFFGAKAALKGDKVPDGTDDQIWLDKVLCAGNENFLENCTHNGFGNIDCNHGEDAGVECVVVPVVTGDKCRPETNPCHANATCTSNVWSHTCTCNKGFYGDGVDCKAIMIRLQGPESKVGKGLLEVLYQGMWGTVCKDGWTSSNANVACRQLGFEGTDIGLIRSHLRGIGAIWLDDVTCTGNEKLLASCSHRPWGVHNCDHSEDVLLQCKLASVTVPCPAELNTCELNGRCVNTGGSVTCFCTTGFSRNGSGCKEIALRLQGPDAQSGSGRVEVFYRGQWGTVCDDDWDLNDAHVVCRQLGYYGAKAALGGGQVSDGTGQIWLDDVGCVGNETFLSTCRHRGWGSENCGHGEDAGVQCQTVPDIDECMLGNYSCHPNATCKNTFGSYECKCNTGFYGDGVHCQDSLVRLQGNETKFGRGRVEVFYNGQWGTVCDDDWDLNDANVVCRQLGFSGAKAALQGAAIPDGSGQIWLDNVRCTGIERSVFECPHAGWGIEDCGHSEDAGVECLVGNDVDECRLGNYSCHQNATCRNTFGSYACECTKGYSGNGTHCEEILVRLNGPKSQSGIGRVEIFNQGKWGTVCDDDWDLLDAKVVCRQLGFLDVREIIAKVNILEATGPIWLDNVACTGNETTLAGCNHRGWGVEDCSHSEDVKVACLLVPDIDECFFPEKYSCHPNATCRNTMGSYTCECKAGFFGNGTTSCKEIALRLQGPNAQSGSGRVEVFYDGQWGTVCDNNGWTNNDANVVCRQLGFYGEMAVLVGDQVPSRTTPVMLNAVTCVGNEQFLAECYTQPSWGYPELILCPLEHAVGVQCLSSPDIVLRLQGPQVKSGIGRVEIFYNRTWGTVCDDGWSLNNAHVVCRQLGFSGAKAALQGNKVPDGTGPIWLDNVACNGGEKSLANCSHRGWGNQNCYHSEDAGVECAVPDIDECASGNYPCSPNATCENTIGSYTCTCNTGFHGNGTICEELLFNVRLQGPNAKLGKGRVEIFYNGQWGTVCDDKWDLNAANVVCRQLGFREAKQFLTGSDVEDGSGEIWLDDVTCTGQERSLGDCTHRGWGIDDCSHSEDVGVECIVSDNPLNDCRQGFSCHPNATCTNTSGTYQCVCKNGYMRNGTSCKEIIVRLQGPEAQSGIGRVEVFYNGQWGTVCDDGWDLNDANVVCRQLGFSGAKAALQGSKVPNGTGEIWLDEVACTGSERFLAACHHSDWKNNDCKHTEDAGVECLTVPDIDECASGNNPCDPNATCKNTIGSYTCTCNDGFYGNGITCKEILLRLQGPNVQSGIGRVEVFYNGQWGTVCDDSWDLNDANVVCRQLGFPGAKAALKGDKVPDGTGPIWLDNVICAGNETFLASCSHNGWGTSDCSNQEDAGVECLKTPDIDECRSSQNPCHENATCTNTLGSYSCACNNGFFGDGKNCQEILLRLQGPNAQSGTGRVEVFYNGQWGTVCDDSWDLNDAKVVCRQLGLFGAKVALYGSQVPHGTGPIWLKSVGCKGSEPFLANCSHPGWKVENCHHSEDAGVRCFEPDVDECRLPNNSCHQYANCKNTYGSYMCECRTGYHGNGTNCEDINECASGNNPCDPNATCKNTIGSCTCTCNDGFGGNGITCKDLTCSLSSNTCAKNSECTKVRGIFICTCSTGYSGNGLLCDDIDECSLGSHNCSTNARCTNTNGSFNCTCNGGYSGNGVVCNDINECQIGSHGCQANASCINTHGSFTCACKKGFSGNGVTCQEMKNTVSTRHDTGSSSNHLVILAYVIGFLILVVGAVVLTVFCLKRRKRNASSPVHEDTGYLLNTLS